MQNVEITFDYNYLDSAAAHYELLVNHIGSVRRTHVDTQARPFWLTAKHESPHIHCCLVENAGMFCDDGMLE